MKTEIIEDVAIAAEILQRGGLVAFPTETVYGLGADATNAAAIERLFVAKGRPSNNPLIVHLACLTDWTRVASELPGAAKQFMEAFAPGPISVVIPKAAGIPNSVTAGLSTVGVRIPAHPLARQLISVCGVPLAAPSANRSGRPSCTTWQSVLEDLDGRIDAILRSAPCAIGVESSVVDCTTPDPVLLRVGGVTLQQLQRVVPATRQVASETSATQVARSPGLLHRHYQPAAEVLLFSAVEELKTLDQALTHKAAYLGLQLPPRNALFELTHVFPSTEAYATGYYEALRATDRLGLLRVYVQASPVAGIGGALRDRQNRSAETRPRLG